MHLLILILALVLILKLIYIYMYTICINIYIYIYIYVYIFTYIHTKQPCGRGQYGQSSLHPQAIDASDLFAVVVRVRHIITDTEFHALVDHG